MGNKVLVAAAGSRKTTHLVEEAISSQNRHTLITTYTIENLQQLVEYVSQRIGCVPSSLQVSTWYSFLLRDGVRPYQSSVYPDRRISNICFVEGRSTRGVAKGNVTKYYLSDGERIFTDKIADFVCQCNERSGGLVIRRLEDMYDQIFIDESQDLAGYDFDLLELLLRSRIHIRIVGDCRQSTYFTNCSPKNSRYKGYNICRLFADWETEGLCDLEERNESYRCNQQICDFADRLYRELKPTVSRSHSMTGHEGIFLVGSKDVHKYYSTYEPVVLRDTIKTSTADFPAKNFGIVKGKTFDRVLIFPNGPIRSYLQSGDPSPLKPRSRAGLYVAVTRARHSVAFVFEGASAIPNVSAYGL
jgi:DNA helicase-2/ATP-dependent DNA helicase PcrA